MNACFFQTRACIILIACDAELHAAKSATTETLFGEDPMRSEINQKSEVVEGKLFVDCSTAVATLLSSRICDVWTVWGISAGLGSKKIRNHPGEIGINLPAFATVFPVMCCDESVYVYCCVLCTMMWWKSALRGVLLPLTAAPPPPLPACTR